MRQEKRGPSRTCSCHDESSPRLQRLSRSGSMSSKLTTNQQQYRKSASGSRKWVAETLNPRNFPRVSPPSTSPVFFINFNKI